MTDGGVLRLRQSVQFEMFKRGIIYNLPRVLLTIHLSVYMHAVELHDPCIHMRV